MGCETIQNEELGLHMLKSTAAYPVQLTRTVQPRQDRIWAALPKEWDELNQPNEMILKGSHQITT